MTQLALNVRLRAQGAAEHRSATACNDPEGAAGTGTWVIDCRQSVHRALQVSLPSNFTQYLDIGALRGTRIGVFHQIA